MNLFTIPKWLHLVLYFVAAAIVAITELAAKGQVAITAPVVAILGFILTTINSIDPETVAKTLPAATLARIVDQKSLALAQKPPTAP